MKNSINEQINQIEKDEIFYPDFKAPVQTNYPIGKYGQLRLDFLKKHRRGSYTTLLTTFKLNEYLYEVDTDARHMVAGITAQLANERDIDERLKTSDPLCWIKEMNNCKTSAEEIVLAEAIYQ